MYDDHTHRALSPGMIQRVCLDPVSGTSDEFERTSLWKGLMMYMNITSRSGWAQNLDTPMGLLGDGSIVMILGRPEMSVRVMSSTHALDEGPYVRVLTQDGRIGWVDAAYLGDPT